MPVNKAIHQSEKGAILIMAAIGLIFLLLVVGVASVNFGMVDRSLTELQMAADNAATAAASRLCSSKKCYENSRKLAVEVLSNHTALNSIGGGRMLDISGLTVPDDEFTWSDPVQNINVTIERGVWQGDNFVSFEGEWQQQHPGIPAFIAANAVRIQIRRPNTNLLVGPVGGSNFALSAKATAVKGATEPTQVSPFALPVCALINNHGDYYGEQSGTELCKADRHFTRADRFETISGSTAGANRGPAFPYEPCNREVQKSPYTYKWPTWPDGVMGDFPLNRQADWGFFYFPNLSNLNKFLTDYHFPNQPAGVEDGSSCLLAHGNWSPGWGVNGSLYGADSLDLGMGSNGWGGRPGFPEPDPHSSSMQFEDVYGVVGLPTEVASGDIEGDIQAALSNTNDPSWPAAIGQSFTILPGGLSSAATDQALWRAIINSDLGGMPGDNDTSHPRIGSTPIGTFDREKVVFSANLSAVNSGGDLPEQCPGYDESCIMSPYNPPDSPALLQNGVEWVYSGASRFDGVCNSKWVNFNNFRITTGVGYWHDEFAMSADEVRTSGLDDNTPVWHVSIPVVADSSAGAASCFGIDGSASQDPLPNVGNEFIIIGFVEGYIFDTDIGNPQPHVTFTYPGGYTHTLKAYGFMSDVPGVDSCNDVHSRLACKRWFIPDSNLDPEPITKLAE